PGRGGSGVRRRGQGGDDQGGVTGGAADRLAAVVVTDAQGPATAGTGEVEHGALPGAASGPTDEPGGRGDVRGRADVKFEPTPSRPGRPAPAGSRGRTFHARANPRHPYRRAATPGADTSDAGDRLTPCAATRVPLTT